MYACSERTNPSAPKKPGDTLLVERIMHAMLQPDFNDLTSSETRFIKDGLKPYNGRT